MNLDEILQIRLSTAEKEVLRLAAKESEQSMSDIVRSKIFDENTPLCSTLTEDIVYIKENILSIKNILLKNGESNAK